MLQELLNLGLLDIGSDDSRFEKMEAASAALAERLESEPSALLAATLIALDSDASADEPLFAQVEELVIAEWKTLRNTHLNRPRELLRAIIIDALGAVSQENPNVAGVIWYTAASVFNHGQARLGKEADLLAGLLRSLGEYVEQEAIVRMSGGAELVTPKPLPKKKGGKLKPPELTVNDVIDDIARSAGPSVQGASSPNPNPHWPNNSPQAWANEYSSRMAEALVKAINLGSSRLAETLNVSTVEQVTFLDDRLTDLINVQRAGKVQLDVLWWLESKYSTSLLCSYRELSPAVSALVMAHDLSELVPALAPASVTYILSEAVTSLAPTNAGEKRALGDLLSPLADSPQTKGLFTPTPIKEGRVPLIDVAIEALGSQIKPGDFRSRTGVNPALEVTIRDFAVWLLRGLQARKLLEGLK